MRTSDGGYAILEINTLPGFTANSLVPKAAQLAHITFDDLVERLVRRAAQRSPVTSGSQA
jgi:D-alanine-D-alanine ligase